jgi:hypothetical protein
MNVQNTQFPGDGENREGGTAKRLREA